MCSNIMELIISFSGYFFETFMNFVSCLDSN